MTNNRIKHGHEGERGQSPREKGRPQQGAQSTSSEAEEIPGQLGGKEGMENRKPAERKKPEPR